MEYRKTTQHRIGRRAFTHDYSRPGTYHITIHVADGLGQPLGAVVGNDAETAAIALTAAGAAVEHELLTAITAHYPMITVDTHVVMPEHLHFILNVRAAIVSKNGRSTHLGQVIAGFKKGCNRAYWALQPAAALPPAAPCAPGAPGGSPAGSLCTPCAPGSPCASGASGAPGGSPAGSRPPSTGSSGRAPLFAPTYCDVMPLKPGQLDTQRAYIKNNPRSRWLRTHNRARLQVQRGAVGTALTVAALRGFLRRECAPNQATDEALAALERRLLVTANGNTAALPAAKAPGAFIVCDSYGDSALLTRRLLPVVCHRRDKARFDEQKARCLHEAAAGAVLVSARIAQGEQAIIDEAANRGFPVVLVADNGFGDRYHPSTERIDRCCAGQLLLVTPWQYAYRHHDEQVTVSFCKAMNCVAQALCRTKDDWWKK